MLCLGLDLCKSAHSRQINLLGDFVLLLPVPPHLVWAVRLTLLNRDDLENREGLLRILNHHFLGYLELWRCFYSNVRVVCLNSRPYVHGTKELIESLPVSRCNLSNSFWPWAETMRIRINQDKEMLSIDWRARWIPTVYNYVSLHISGDVCVYCYIIYKLFTVFLVLFTQIKAYTLYSVL